MRRRIRAVGIEAGSRRGALPCEIASPAPIAPATAAGHLLASERFRKEAEAALGARLGPAPRGRPRTRAGDAEEHQLKIEFQAERRSG